MGTFKELDPKKVLEILQGHEDTLTESLQKEMDYVLDNRCPRCDGTISAEMDIQRTINSSSAHAYYNCRCNECGCLFSPYSGMIVEMGNLGKLEPAIPIIHPSDD